MYEPIDSYPTKPTIAEKIGQYKEYEIYYFLDFTSFC